MEFNIDEAILELKEDFLKGEKGDSFKYEDFTQEQLNDLVGPIKEEEQKRKIAESERVSNEQERLESETNRKTSEEGRKNCETTRIAEESQRVSNEDQRKLNEAERLNRETERKEYETERINSEELRKQEETRRNNNENLRISNENERNTKEELRVSNEENRMSKEIERNSNELLRKENEVTRQNNETIRSQAESTRNSNENLREQAEAAREEAIEIQNQKIAQNTVSIESIQTEQTEQKTSIQNLKNEDLQIKERLELYEKNQIYGSESGAIIAIDDATKCSATLNCSATAQLTKCATNMLDSQKLYEKMKLIVPSTIIEIVEDVQAIKFSNAGFYNSRLIEKRFKENTQYTFRFMCQGPSGQIGKSLYVIVHYTDETKKQVGINAEDAQTFTEAKIISDVNKTIDFITFSYGSSATWYIDMNSVMLYQRK